MVKSFLAGMLIAAALPLYAAAHCGDCCSEEETVETEVSKATSPALPKYEDMQSFDGRAAPYAVELPPQRFAVLKGTLADPGAVWMKAPALAGEQGLLGPGTHAWSIMVKLPETMPPAPDTPYWAGFTLGDDKHAGGELEEYTAPGGKYAMAAHRGPYEGLAATWGKFAPFIFHNANVDPSRPTLEWYYSDPGSTKPEDLITLLYIPIN